MGVDYYMVCKGCGKDWPFFRAQAGGCYVDPQIQNDPLGFLGWMDEHAEHGEIVAVSENGLDALEDELGQSWSARKFTDRLPDHPCCTDQATPSGKTTPD